MPFKKILEKMNNLSPAIWALFLLSTIFFIIQHYFIVSWDFSAYVLNAKYMFSNSAYFELPRPPLASFIIGIFLWLGNLSEYIFILFTSILFLYSSISLSDALFFENRKEIKLDKNFIRFLFYFFSLSVFCLNWGMKVGTEILSLSLLELAISQTIRGKNSGVYLGLAFLARYPLMIFAPLLLFYKSIKNIAKNILFFLLTILPWLIYNYLKFGNPLASILDSYALNVFFRDYIIKTFRVLDILDIAGIFTITAIIGLFYVILKIKENFFSMESKIALMMLFLTILIIYSYTSIPLKEIRYLFNFILPIAYLSTLSIIFIAKKPYKKVIKIITVLCLSIFILNFFVLSTSVAKDYNHIIKFKEAGLKIQEINLENCAIYSPHWVPVTYFTQNIYPLSQSISEKVSTNSLVLIFRDYQTIDNQISNSEIDNNQILYSNKDFILFGKKNLTAENCTSKYVYDQPYYDKNHCNLIDKYKIIKNICLFFSRDI